MITHLSEANSQKIRLLSVILTFLVIVIHSKFSESLLQRIFSGGFATLAVPGFYIISAFFLFRSTQNFHWYQISLKKRFFSILLPWVFWTLLFWLGYGLLIQWTSLSRCFLTSFPAAIVGHFWYLRNLVVLLIIAPIFLAVLNTKFLKWIFLFLALGAYLTKLDFTGWKINSGNFVSVFYFTIGGLLATSPNFSAFWGTLLKKRLCQFILLGLWISCILFSAFFSHNEFSGFINRAGHLCGLLSLWFLADLLLGIEQKMAAYGSVWQRMAAYSFFIYCIHMPICFSLHPIAQNYFPASMGYIFVTITTFSLSLLIAIIVKKLIPPLYSILSGGR